MGDVIVAPRERASVAPQWDHPLRVLLADGVLEGAALLSNQGECEHAYGSLKHVFDAAAPPAAAQFLDLFERHDDVEPSFTLAGDKFITIRRTECALHAFTRGRRRGLCVHNLPVGLLLVVFPRSQLPQYVLSTLEVFCDGLRS